MSLSGPPSSWRPDDSLWGIAVILSLLTVFALGIVLVWLPTTPPPPFPIEQYAPLPNGASYVYRVTGPDGAVTYRYRNVTRANGLTFGADTNVNVFSALYAASGFSGASEDSEGLAAALRALPAARMTDVQVNAAGQVTQTVTTLVLGPTIIEIVGVDEVGVEPPLPMLSDQPRVSTSGMLNDTVPFTATLTLKDRATLATPLGALGDCLTTEQQLNLPENSSRALTWFCSGVGETRDERNDEPATNLTTSALIAASVNQLVRGIAPNLPASDLTGATEFQFQDPVQLPVLELWSYSEKYNNPITSSIVPVGDLALYGTQNGVLVAYNQAEQREQWRFQTGGPIFGAPVAAGGIVYFGSGDKKLYAVNALTGGYLWAFAAQDVITGSPALSANTVYFGSEDRNVYALDALSGSLRWRATTGGPVTATPVISNGVVLIGSDDGALYALNAISGSSRWVYKTGGAVTGRAVSDDDVIYVASYDKQLYALEANPESRSGAVRWEYDAQDYIPFGPTLADGRLFVVTPRQVRAVEARTGAQLWRYESEIGLAGPVIAMGEQVWVTRQNDLQALDAATGQILGATPHSDFLVNAGSSSDGRALYRGDLNGVLRAFGSAP